MEVGEGVMVEDVMVEVGEGVMVEGVMVEVGEGVSLVAGCEVLVGVGLVYIVLLKYTYTIHTPLTIKCTYNYVYLYHSNPL